MYHGKQGEAPFSSTANYHSSVSRRIGQLLLKHIGTELMSQINKKDLVFADFGTSDGILALHIFNKITEIPDIGCSHYSIYLNDTPLNDFNLLAANVSDSNIYRRDDVSIMMNVGNMYNKCLPTGSVTIATSIEALIFLDDVHILSREDNWLRDTLLPPLNRGPFAPLAARDWRNFLDARSVEMTSGGIVVANFEIESRHPYLNFMSEAWDAAFKMGLVKKDEHQRCLIPFFMRTLEEVMEPFIDGVYKGLKLVSTKVYTIEYIKQDPDSNGLRDMDVFASKFIRSIMSWSRNFFHRSLNRSRSEEEKCIILDELYKNIGQRIANSPYEQCDINLLNLAAVKT